MTAIFFKSEALNRTVYLSGLADLSSKDLAVLGAELEIDIESMQLKMHQKRDDATSDWLFSISLKITICKQFLQLSKKFSDPVESLSERFYQSVEKSYGKQAAKSCLAIAREQLRFGA